MKRNIKKILNHPDHRGFLGPGHTARAIIDGKDFAASDPFILLMDDVLDLPGGNSVGGPHPHAGFETVTLVLEGNEDWKTGSMEIMTAGKGIVHTEEITAKTKMRILQLWLVLPPDQRWAEPFFQRILLENVPTMKSDTSEIRVYSGTSQGLTSPVKNQTPFTLVDFIVNGQSKISQELPPHFSSFMYVIEGSVSVGGDKVETGQSAWFSTSVEGSTSEIELTVDERGARFILYAGEPQRAEIVSGGPFIGDSQQDIFRLYKEYRSGQIPHLNDLPSNRKVEYNATGLISA